MKNSLFSSPLLSLLALPVFAFAQTKEESHEGMTVFGNIYINEGSKLTAFGDVNLEADILGEGTLQLYGKKSQKIISKKASVNHLEISNSEYIAIIGELNIAKTFSVNEGNVVIEIGSKLNLDFEIDHWAPSFLSLVILRSPSIQLFD